ncbi:phage head closure protein [uncultured Clostridium sp.]|uniref:phage head closure protein n=1 Tax=uncultured Clostridium sp. TaxID=59620 RepID=UPI0026740952|nr:phage head closure protein [uncultured Clostridium sp.]
MWSNSLILISERYDSDVNEIVVENKKEVYCHVKSISRNEFYKASTGGFKPSLVFKIHSFEYDNEEKVEFDGITYNVIRTYMVNTEEIELTCEKVLGN